MWTYFKRYRMECDLADLPSDRPATPAGYRLLADEQSTARMHADAKFESFRGEVDAHVFPCLGRRDGCLRLMREIASRGCFVPEATWLIQTTDRPARCVGTVQGLAIDGWGAIQNLGIVPDHRGRGLGTVLLWHAGVGFREAGLNRMHLEVTGDNPDAMRLYERIGFRVADTVFKAAEVPGQGS